MNSSATTTLTEYIIIINKKLNNFVQQQDNLQKNIYEAMSYSLNAGGKRLRGALTMEFAKITAGEQINKNNTENASVVGAAIELIHTYSLIHDDLPAMDNDDLRRGKPTNHIVFGEATAILAGDALLNLSAEVVLKYCEISAEQKLDILGQIYKSSGTNGMIGGQIIDMEYENKKADIDTLNYIYSLKTGALFEASCVCGCICSGDYSKIANARNFAQYIGLAFQITDDILDVTGESEVLGKNTNSDTQNKKSTYVSLLGLEKAKIKAEEYIEKAKSQLSFFEKSEFLYELCDMILTRKV